MATSPEVEADLRRRIAEEFAPGDRLPKLNELMQAYGLRSRSAMDRILRTLAAEGRLTVRHGSGIYVSRRHVVHRNLVRNIQLEHARSLRGEVAEGGLFEAMTGVEEVRVDTSYELVNASDAVASRLQVEKGSALLLRIFRYTIADVPHQVTRSYMTADLANRAGLTSPASEQPGIGTIMQLRRAGSPPDHVRISLESRIPTPGERDQLSIGPGTPVMEHWRTMCQQGTPLEVSNSIVPSDRVGYELEIELEDEA
ncbi:GntR family transcriptional regulator [Streptosporangium sp. NBC_01469]|uniref:GntR family transcriptional regulator n=1 Tax=Streptosporangium sp. NBC_01469 TaxID=2903898 RepID=UPI002E2B81B3|nr:GntR family transcriptional regulator [Streptosporangium sp. NBC_01469]